MGEVPVGASLGWPGRWTFRALVLLGGACLGLQGGLFWSSGRAPILGVPAGVLGAAIAYPRILRRTGPPHGPWAAALPFFILLLLAPTAAATLLFPALRDQVIPLAVGLVVAGACVPYLLVLAEGRRWNGIVTALVAREGMAVASLAVGVVVLWATLSVLRVEALHPANSDLGLFNEIFWATLHGEPYYTAVRETNYLGDHFSPLVLVPLPAYILHPGPDTLVVANAVILGLGAIPLYFIALHVLGRRPGVGLGVVGAYLLYPATEWFAAAKYTPDVVGVPILFALLYFVLVWRPLPFLLCSLTYLMVKEDRAPFLVALGLYVGLYIGRRWQGLLVAGVASAWLTLAVAVVMPALSGRPYEYFDRYAGTGGPPGLSALGTLTVQPLERATFLLALLAPLLFLPLLNLGWRRWDPSLHPNIVLTALPPLAEALLSDVSSQFSILGKAPWGAAPVLFVGAILGVRSLVSASGGVWGAARRYLRVLPRLPPRGLMEAAVAGILVSTVIAGAFVGPPYPGARAFDASLYVQEARQPEVLHLVARIPANASVSVQCCPTELSRGLVVLLSDRQTLHVWPRELRPTDYLVVEADRLSASEYQALAAGTTRGPWLSVAEGGGLVLFRAPDAPPPVPA